MAKKKLVVSLMLFMGTVFSNGVWAGSEHHWSYSGEEGPEHWAELDVKYSPCDGQNQSPINLSGMIEGELPHLEVNYKPGGYEVINNGHTVQINYQPGSFIEIAGHEFELKQFHFHAPSENTIEGVRFPMEAHFVHLDNDGKIAVVAVMFEEGEKNSELAKGWRHTPKEVGGVNEVIELINADVLLDSTHEYYRFNGSLTTPPCTEGVTWLVFKHYDQISAEQIAAFVKIVPFANNRPLQPINARTIIK
jgi:carbonic anhydrase